jgi:hypothetical protein
VAAENHRPRGPTRTAARVARRLSLAADTAVLGFGAQGNAPATVVAGALSLLLRLAEDACERHRG